MAVRKEYNQSWNPYWMNQPEVPVASDEAIGGVKVGDGLEIEEDGTLNAEGEDPYVLPKASDETLGGIKVGDGLEIEEDGTLNVGSGNGVAKLAAGSFVNTMKAIAAAMAVGDSKKIYAEYIEFPMYIDGEHSGHPQGYSIGEANIYIGGYESIESEGESYIRFSVMYTGGTEGAETFNGSYIHVKTTITDGTGTQVRLRKPVITIEKGETKTDFTIVYEGLTFMAKAASDIKIATGAMDESVSVNQNGRVYYKVDSSTSETNFRMAEIDVDGICNMSQQYRVTPKYQISYSMLNDGTEFAVSTTDIYRFQFNNNSVPYVAQDVIKIRTTFCPDMKELETHNNCSVLESKTLTLGGYLDPFMKIGDGIVV